MQRILGPKLYKFCRMEFQADKPERPNSENVLKTYFPNGWAIEACPSPTKGIRASQGQNPLLSFKAFLVKAQWRDQRIKPFWASFHYHIKQEPCNILSFSSPLSVSILEIRQNWQRCLIPLLVDISSNNSWTLCDLCSWGERSGEGRNRTPQHPQAQGFPFIISYPPHVLSEAGSTDPHAHRWLSTPHEGRTLTQGPTALVSQRHASPAE